MAQLIQSNLLSTDELLANLHCRYSVELIAFLPVTDLLKTYADVGIFVAAIYFLCPSFVSVLSYLAGRKSCTFSKLSVAYNS